MKKLIIAGGRDFNNYEYLQTKCDEFLNNKEAEIVSGTAKGADKLGEQYAKDRGYNLIQFPANWNTHGKSAGYKRNLEMGIYANMLIAFWDGESKGTKHMIDIAIKLDLKVKIVKYIMI